MNAICISSTCCPKVTAALTIRANTIFMPEGYGYRWFRIGALDYLLRRSDIDVPHYQ
jgi:hypothetical protein